MVKRKAGLTGSSISTCPVKFHGGRSFLFILTLSTMVLFSAYTETSTSVDIMLLPSLIRVGEKDYSLSVTGTGEASLKAENNRNVRAELALKAIILPNQDQPLPITLPRAFIKVRFPHFRATLGKTRVSWGDGSCFNAGDLLFGSTSIDTELTEQVIRDETAWLASLYVPMGRFSFAEAVFIPPDPLAAITDDKTAYSLPPIEHTQAGGRAVTKLFTIKTEGGYLYRGEEKTHNIYAALQGHLLADWNISASTSIPSQSPEGEDLKDSLLISAGLFHLQRLGIDSQISFRLEALLRPWGTWEEIKNEVVIMDSTAVYPPPEGANYALFLYPEITLGLSRSINLSLRSLVSPVDLSAMFLLGNSWNMYQGFDILTFILLQAGEENDIFSLERPGGLAFSLGFRFKY
ncbi:MAG: hypothetical protein DRP87_08025 [Spirochaetes bacterium]|nr:MAG: hypothetical protein DRP87_08025 [Spirochaetota bacterium]